MSRLNPVHYLLLVIAFSWTPWFIAIVSNSNIHSTMGMACMIIGGAGPTLAALLLLKQSTRHQISSYWHRVFDIRRISFGMGCIIVLLMPLLASLSIGISTLWGHSLNQFTIIDSLRLQPTSIFMFAIMLFFFGPLPEELGWRGYWLDVLGRKYSLFTTSIIIGTVWAAWHLPLFYLPGYPLQEMDANTIKLVVFFGDLIPKSILLSWIYCCTNRSILAAILFHFMINFTGSLIEIDIATEVIQMILLVAVAAGLLVFKRKLFFTPAKGSQKESS